MIVAAVLIVAGILARRWARATGDVLVAVGALPLTISVSQLDANPPRLVAVSTLLVIVMAVLDAASLTGRVGSAHRWPLTAATAAAAAIAGLGMAQADTAPAVVLSTMGGAALLAVLAVAGYRHRRRIS